MMSLTESLRPRITKNLEDWIQRQLAPVGIVINGPNPWDPQVHDSRLYRRVLLEHSVGAGEAYMDGWWDCEALDAFFYRLFSCRLGGDNRPILGRLAQLPALIFNLQSKARAHQVNEEHYDLGENLYQAMLDQQMVYTCGYWPGAQTLEQAQTQKLDLVCRKLGLKPGMTLLDIGCGFGSLLKYAATHYGVSGVGYTLSEGQYAFAKKSCEGLPIEIRLQDYREIQGQYDRVASIGMFEAVGQKNLRTFMEVAHSALETDGMLLLHTIGKHIPRAPSRHWVDKYIFPNGYVPDLAELVSSTHRLFRVEDVHNFGPCYDKTLMSWHERFQQGWPALREQYGDRFERMWQFYLLLFAGGFRARQWQLWQIVMCPADSLIQSPSREIVHSRPLRKSILRALDAQETA